MMRSFLSVCVVVLGVFQPQDHWPMGAQCGEHPRGDEGQVGGVPDGRGVGVEQVHQRRSQPGLCGVEGLESSLERGLQL